MLVDILLFLLQVAVTLVGGACLVRALMRWRRMSFAHPVGRLVQAFSDWLVLPLQRVLPSAGRLDLASLLATWLLKLVQYALLIALLDLGRWGVLPVLAVLGALRLAIAVAMAIVIIAAVLSWTQNETLVGDVVARLAEPLLAPLRRVIPAIGGVDLSPLVAVVGLQVLAMVVAPLQENLLGSVLALGAG